MPEAQWSLNAAQVALPAPDDDAVAAVLVRVLRQAKKDFVDVDAPWPDDEYEAGQQASLQQPLGLVLPPATKRRRVAVADGFSLHADTAVHGNDRQGLERLCPEPALSVSKGRARASGRIKTAATRRRALRVHAEEGLLLHPHGAGTGTPSGVPHSAREDAPHQLSRYLRPARCAAPSRHAGAFFAGFTFSAEEEAEAAEDAAVGLGGPAPAHPFDRLRTGFGTDVLHCPCGGRRRILAIHSTRTAAEARLRQLGHPLPPRNVLPPATAQPFLPLAG